MMINGYSKTLPSTQVNHRGRHKPREIIWQIPIFCLVTVLSISSTESYAQQQQIEHPTWLPTLPGYAEVPSNYAEVVVGELIADARENPGFLPTTHSPFGQTNGFQVISPDGTVFVVDNIDEPRCAVFAQYVATGDDENFVMDQGGIVSNVYIENVNFDGCN